MKKPLRCPLCGETTYVHMSEAGARARNHMRNKHPKEWERLEKETAKVDAARKKFHAFLDKEYPKSEGEEAHNAYPWQYAIKPAGYQY